MLHYYVLRPSLERRRGTTATSAPHTQPATARGTARRGALRGGTVDAYIVCYISAIPIEQLPDPNSLGDAIECHSSLWLAEPRIENAKSLHTTCNDIKRVPPHATAPLADTCAPYASPEWSVESGRRCKHTPGNELKRGC